MYVVASIRTVGFQRSPRTYVVEEYAEGVTLRIGNDVHILGRGLRRNPVEEVVPVWPPFRQGTGICPIVEHPFVDARTETAVDVCHEGSVDATDIGIVNTGDPKHADIFLVTGGVNAQNLPVVRQIYEQMPEPKVVIAVGTCACSGGIFRECYNMLGGMDKAIPVDVYVPGCAARPEAIIDGVVKGLSVLEEKQKKLRKG